MKSQKEKAVEFRNMHLSEEILVLANAWDVPSARIFEQAGFPAIGTTSAGIALSHGYPDGQKISRDEMLQVVGRIAKSVSIPVTADVEAGYGEEVTDVAETAKRVISAGAIGLNIEDSTKKPEKPLYDVETQTRRIAIIRKVTGSLDVPLVINARTDVLIAGKGDSELQLKPRSGSNRPVKSLVSGGIAIKEVSILTVPSRVFAALTKPAKLDT